LNSIRVFLVTTTLALLVLVVFISAVQGFQSSMREAERLFDSQLQEQAHFAVNLRSGEVVDTGSNAPMAYQLWSANSGEKPRIIARTDNAPLTPISDFQPGFDYANFSGYRWRTYVYLPLDQDMIVIAAARQDVRYRLAENVIIEAILPVVTWLPLSGLLIWLIVGRGLRPLKELSNQLTRKESRDLSMIRLPNHSKELDPVIQSVNALLLRLQAAFDREKRFASDAAHELRTPIAALKIQLHNLSEKLADKSPDEDKEIRQLAAGVERMQHLIEQILALYRVSPEQFTARFVPVDIYELTQSLIAEHYTTFECRDQTIELTANGGDEPVTALIEGDKFALETLIINLLSNANKYTPEGGQIRVDVSIDKHHVILSVTDNGPGIPAADRERIFERFYRVGNDRHSSGQSGCGLGLAIVKNIALLHDAHIEVTDAPVESGTSFTVYFRRLEMS